MSLPTLAKTWQFNVNQRVTAQGTTLATCQAVMQLLKNTLKGFASNPWTVIGSSNSVASGMDASDRWVTAANLVWVTSAIPHSWIVLQQAGINAKFQLCIDLLTVGAPPQGRINAVVSPTAGFGTANGGTNGSTTARPTATDEIVLLNGVVGGNGQWMDAVDAGSNVDILLNVWQSSDGQVTRFVFRSPTTTSNQFRGYAAFEKPKNPIAAWTNPCVATWFCSTAGVLLYTTLNDAAFYLGNKPGGGSMALFCTTEGAGTSMLGEFITTINDLTGGYQITPMGLASTTSGSRGRHGELFDIWYGVTTLQDGDTYPANGTKQFIQMGNLALPWDGSSPIMS